MFWSPLKQKYGLVSQGHIQVSKEREVLDDIPISFKRNLDVFENEFRNGGNEIIKNWEQAASQQLTLLYE